MFDAKNLLDQFLGGGQPQPGAQRRGGLNDIEAVARGGRTPEEAASIYTASLLAIDVDNAAERGYLAMLAARLNLDDALVKHLHDTVESASALQPMPAA